MGIKTGKRVLGNSLLLNSFVPLTAGTCLLVSANPCFAHGGNNSDRGMRHHDGGRHGGFSAVSNLNQLQNGFTQAFNQRVQRNTTGVDSRRFDLDLSSSLKNIELGSKIFNGSGSVTISADGGQQTFSAGDKVTAAEYVAIQQVLSQSPQSISVSAQGTASGGSFALDQAAASHVNNLVIPQSVSAVNNFANNRSVNLSGDLTNLGSIYGISTSNKVRSGVIAADDINNSGSISTDTQKQLDLTLVADHNFTNTGSITSSGALTVASAYGAVNNSGSVTAQHGDLYVFAGNGNLTNSGSISALNGNLNIDASQVASDLNINGVGGSFNALHGDINVRDVSYTDSNDTTMTGGTYNAQNINLYAGGGTVNASVDEFNGKLNTSGLAAHVLTQGGTLTLGTNCLTGDPTFANTTGDILITGGVVAGESIAILAAGDIIASGNAFISTANSTGTTAVPNTNVTLVAGALVTTTGAQSTTLPGSTGIGTGQTATVDFTGGTGGNIDFSGSSHAGPLIDTSSNLVGGGGGNQQRNGGNVFIAARSNGVDNGFVIFPASRPSIDTSSFYNNAGSVTIIAGGPTGSKSKTPTVTTGNINTQADTVSGNNSGNVTIFAAQPESTTGAPITFNSSGDITGVPTFETNPVNLTFTNGNIQFNGAILADNGNVTVQTGTGGISQLASKGAIARIQGNTVTFTAGVGGIGAGLSSKKPSRILTEANTLALTSGSNIFINNLGSVTLGSAAVPNTVGGNLGIVDITTTADQSGSGRITVRSGQFIQASSGLLTSVNLVSSGDIGGAGGIRTPGGATIIATAVTLSDVNPLTPTTLGSGFGDIGQNGATTHINIDSSTVSASTQGNVFLQSTGTITLLDSTAGNGKIFELKAIPDGGGNGQIIIAGTIASAFGRIGTLTLQSSENSGTGGIIPGGTLVADTVNLRDDDGAGNLGFSSIGTAAAPIVVDTSHLNVDTAGLEINVENVIQTGMELLGVNTNALRSGTFTLLSASTVHINGTLNVVNSASITASTGNILVDADINLSGATPTVFLTTSSGSIYSPGGEVRPQNLANAGNLSVTLTSSSGGVGTDVVPFLMEAGNLTSNVAGFTNIYNQNTANLTLLATTAKSQFTLETDGALIINAPITTATGIKLATTSGAAGITLNALIGGSATKVVEIDTNGTGDITAAPGVIITSTQLVKLSTDGGDIGAIGNALTVSTAGLSANTNGAPGTVTINALAAKKSILTLFNSASFGDFTLTAAGSVLLNDLLTVDGSIFVSTTAGTLSTNTNSIIQVAEPGNPTTLSEQITLLNTSAKASKGGALISIGAGSKIQTFTGTPGTGNNGSGAILISLTGPNPARTNTTPPTNVVIGTQSGGGQTFFGTNGITALAPNNTMDNIGADIVFDTGTKPATSIVLGGGVLIHADPPVTGSAPMAGPVSLPTMVQGVVAPQTVPTVDSGLAQVSNASLTQTAVMPSTLPSTANNSALNNSGVQIDNNGLNSSLTNFATLAAKLSNAQTTINFSSAQKDGWISETELASGEIPAQIFGDVTVSGDATAGADLEYPTTVSPAQLNHIGNGQPLVGAVSSSVGPKVATLNRGTLVVAPSTDAVINTPVGQIKIGAKSLALVMAFANGLAVYDLDDVRKGAVEVVAGGKSITMSPGQHIFVTNSNVRGFEDVNPAQMIGYRGITSRDLNNGLKVFSAEFCVPHACHAVKPLKHLLQSNHPQDKKVAAHFLKTTAVTMQLRGHGGEFQQVFRPRKTAWAQ